MSRPSQPGMPVADPSLGRLAQYQLLQRIAAGGMGELLLARTRGAGGFEKLVAVKRILPHLGANAEFVQMFLEEARIAATLEHPNIVHVSDLGCAGKTYFFVMPFLEGRDLAAIQRALAHRRELMPLPLALYIGSGIAAGLHYAHTKRDRGGKPMSLIHRDVSPHNIFVTFEGEVKLLDFGIAKVNDGPVQTHVGMRKGKAQYMSPEQALGVALDPRTDVFSLGIVMYELTTGRALFRGESDLAVLNRVATGEVESPRERVADYPPQLERIIMRALERDPSRRFSTALEFRNQLVDFARDALLAASGVELGAYLTELVGNESAIEIGAGERATSIPSVPPPPPTEALFPHERSMLAPPADVAVHAAESPQQTRAPGGRPPPSRWRWLVLASVVLVAGSVAAWRIAGRQRDPVTAPAAVGLGPARTDAPAVAATASEEQLLALVNEPSLDRALDYEERTELVVYLRRRGRADEIDEALQLTLDLLQANEAARPCAVFAAALTRVEAVRSPYFLPTLRAALVPAPPVVAHAGLAPDASCEGLDARLAAIRTAIADAHAAGPRRAPITSPP